MKMRLEDATSYTAKCFNGEPASCSYACPFRLDLRTFMDRAARGKWSSAYKTLSNAVVFPSLVAALCPQPCRNHCQRTQIGDEALMIRDLESACIRFAKNKKPVKYAIPPKTKSVAVVGAGPAGLSFALNLSRKRYLVTVFEKTGGWGGALREHEKFPEFDQEFTLLFSAVETDFQFNREIKSLEELSGFDAVYIATGRGGETFGLKDTLDDKSMATGKPGVFMGGAVCDMPLMESIALGTQLSQSVEVFLETGKLTELDRDADRIKCERYLRHDGEEKKPVVVPGLPDGYTEGEAMSEASRCFQCDCDYCEKSCEMLKSFKKKPHRIAVEVFTDMQGSTLSSRTLTREAYSCNICGHCKSVCPEAVDIGALLQYSRAERLSAGKDIPAFHDYWLREMDYAVTKGAYASAAKEKTSAKYAEAKLAPAGFAEAKFAFFPGCQLGAYRPEHVVKSYEYLADKYDAGLVLTCCGAPAYWAGDMDRFQKNIDQILKQWNELGKPVFVFACATCETLFQAYMPEIKRISLYELMAKDDALQPVQGYENAAIFDPCNARDDPEMQTSVRKLAEKAGTDLTELPEKNRCCGYGGQIRLANPSLYEEITKNRSEASDKPYIVYCANCREVFASREKPVTHILDMVFGLEPLTGVQTLQEKRNNSLEVKRILMKKLSGEEFQPEPNPWDSLSLVVSDDVQKEMDHFLISAGDVKETVFAAESSGEKFVDEKSGTSLACLIKPVLTYWVQYRMLDPRTFEILSAYYHRMRFIEDDE
ncbi:MAG: NAD(P)-binding protein [Clostridiales bacterium]|nr:NAD(P)-binding protein [Clostridiales bacterium]